MQAAAMSNCLEQKLEECPQSCRIVDIDDADWVVV